MFILAIMIVLKESDFSGFLDFREEIRKSKIIKQKLDRFEQKLTYKFKIIIPMRFLIFELLKNLKLNISYHNYDSYVYFDIMILKDIKNVKTYEKKFFGKKKYISENYDLSYSKVGRIVFKKKDKDTIIESKVTLEVFNKKYNASLMKISKLLTEYCDTVHTFNYHEDRNHIVFSINSLKEDFLIENLTFLSSKDYKNFKVKEIEQEYLAPSHYYC